MGGFGSGRRRWSGKQTTGSKWRLDIRKLHREGVLRPGRRCKRQWSRNGKPAFNISITAAEHHLTLNYHIRSRALEREEVEDCIQLDWTACPLGGQRPWFLCPECDRRVAVLYGVDPFACRHCHNLAYASQREGAGDRALRRAQKIQARLGWDGPDGWRKPIGMHQATFDRLWRAQKHYHEFALMAAMAKLKRFNPLFGGMML